MRYGYLGPETTFTHQALLQALAVMPREFTDTVEQVPFTAVATATTDLLAGDIDALIAPIENSVEGGVSGTLDVLAATDSITIVAEQIVQVTFVLAAREETAVRRTSTSSPPTRTPRLRSRAGCEATSPRRTSPPRRRPPRPPATSPR